MNAKPPIHIRPVPTHSKWPCQHLYNSCAYHQAHFQSASYGLALLRGEQVVGQIFFTQENDQAISLPKAPFGGMEWYDDFTEDELKQWLDLIQGHLAPKITNLLLKNPASIYDKNLEMVELVLAQRGTQIEQAINHHIPIKNVELPSFAPMQQRRWRKCQQAGFKFSQEPISQVEIVYQFILNARHDKNIPVNISYQQLQKNLKAMPTSYTFFTVKHNQEIIAATVAICVNQHVLYHFLPASLTSYNVFSPMVFLLGNLYQYAQQNLYQYIDLGVSTLNHAPQTSLIDFKERIGGVPTTKTTWQLDLI